MFGSLTQKFQQVFSSLSGKKKLTQENIVEAVAQVRLALLDADVNYDVVEKFLARVKEKALGLPVLPTITPDQQFISLIHEELIALMGSVEAPLDLEHKPAVILVCGLQGSGKTTQCAKLAAFLQKKGLEKKPLLVACDLQRPGAVEQLKLLGMKIDVPVFSLEGEKNPLKVAEEAIFFAQKEAFDVLIIDTAGRLHIDEALMQQLEELKRLVQPHEVLFVASANMGQDVVKTAAEFDKRVAITGTILTMLDGNARAGAALSIREVTQKPLKFEGIGEKLEDLQPFHPASMASRILGMGDVINLVRKAKEHIDKKEVEALEKKLQKDRFTYEDYLKQLSLIQKMGSAKGLFKMLPMGNFLGGLSLGSVESAEKNLKQVEAIIYSMTPLERQERVELSSGRKRRIAKGSGTSLETVNQMVKQYSKMKQALKELPALQEQFFKGADNRENSLWR